MNDNIDRNRRTALKVTAGLGAFGFAGLSAGRSADDTVQFSGHDHEARGNATLDAADDSLVVSGLENEGTDGVHTRLAGTTASTTTHDPISLGNTGDAMTISMRGTYDGNPNAPVGQFALTNQTDRIGIDMNTGDISARAISIGVYVDGIRMDTIELTRAEWWFWRNCFSGGGWHSYGVSGGHNPGFGVAFDERVAFQTADGDELDGDAYEFYAIETDQPVEGLSSVEARANVGDVTIRDVRSQ